MNQTEIAANLVAPPPKTVKVSVVETALTEKDSFADMPETLDGCLIFFDQIGQATEMFNLVRDFVIGRMIAYLREKFKYEEAMTEACTRTGLRERALAYCLQIYRCFRAIDIVKVLASKGLGGETARLMCSPSICDDGERQRMICAIIDDRIEVSTIRQELLDARAELNSSQKQITDGSSKGPEDGTAGQDPSGSDNAGQDQSGEKKTDEVGPPSLPVNEDPRASDLEYDTIDSDLLSRAPFSVEEMWEAFKKLPNAEGIEKIKKSYALLVYSLPGFLDALESTGGEELGKAIHALEELRDSLIEARRLYTDVLNAVDLEIDRYE